MDAGGMQSDHSVAKRAAPTGDKPIWEKIQDYQYVFDSFTVFVNLLLLLFVLLRRRMRQDGLYWLVLTLFTSGALQGVVLGTNWLSKRKNGNWQFGETGCIAYYYITDFLEFGWFAALISLAFHLMFQIWSTEDYCVLKKSKKYITVSVILILLSQFAGAALAVATTWLRQVQLATRSSGKVYCRRTGPNRIVVSYIEIGLASSTGLAALILILLTKVGYKRARKFLGTILAVFFMSLAIAIVDDINFLLVKAWDDVPINLKVASVWVKHALPGWATLFWLMDSRIFHSLCCCRDSREQERQTPTTEQEGIALV